MGPARDTEPMGGRATATSLEPVAVVLSDLHLSHRPDDGCAAAAARLVRQHAGCEIMLAGDVLDLSSEDPSHDPGTCIAALFARFVDLRSALRDHLARGGKVTLIAGNHDAALSLPDATRGLTDSLAADERANLEVCPWFVRRGRLHVEHGHVYDPDNAPAHPLVASSPRSEPLGVALTRRFIAPNAAHAFAHDHSTTPLDGIRRALREYGASTPLIIARYFRAAVGLALRSANPIELWRERELGATLVPKYSELVGLPEAVLHDLLAVAPAPTHSRLASMLSRLYFDRALAAAALAAGAVAATTGLRTPGMATAAVALAYLATSIEGRATSYTERPAQQLRDAASRIAELTNAETVVFGHTHLVESGPSYRNTGSFSTRCDEGRPYLVVDAQSRAIIRYAS
jgi:predicted phosphodiesterase